MMKRSERAWILISGLCCVLSVGGCADEVAADHSTDGDHELPLVWGPDVVSLPAPAGPHSLVLADRRGPGVDDLNPCTVDYLSPGGPSHAPVDGPCNDGDPCTAGDRCSLGVCQRGERVTDCDDGSVCTDDSCVPLAGCVHLEQACGDGDACTEDSCDPSAGCRHASTTVGGCRPVIDVTQPQRAAMLVGEDGSVEVRGRVSSRAGPIIRLTVAGVVVPVFEGQFAVRVAAMTGGNTLVVEATDSAGTTRRRVQGYHYARRYADPSESVPRAVTARVASASLAQELSRIASLKLRHIELGRYVPEVVYRGVTHDLVMERFSHAAPIVRAGIEPGALVVAARMDNLVVRLRARGKSMGCLATPLGQLCGRYPDLSGRLTVGVVALDARLRIGARRGRPRVSLDQVRVQLAGVEADLHGLMAMSDRLVDLLTPLFERSVSRWASSVLSDAVAPALQQALARMRTDGDLELTAIQPGAPPVVVGLEARLEELRVTPGWILVELSGLAHRRHPSSVPALGVVVRGRCPGDAPYAAGAGLEVDVSDDLVNRVLAAAWRGGLLEFDVAPETLAQSGLGRFGMTDLAVRVSGKLPPVVSDCTPDRRPRMHVGELQVTARLKLLGQPIVATLFVSFEGGLEIKARERRLRLVLTDVDWFDGELAIQPEGVSEALVETLLRRAVVPLIAEELGGAVLAEVPLPDVSLRTGVVGVQATEVSRRPGGTILRTGVRPPEP
ncbi:MAG: hypothetical protein ACI9WU_002543 [Myxococcota bacterium]|jgi:hypothetical protein